MSSVDMRKADFLPEVKASACKSVCLFCLADLPPEVENMMVLTTVVPHGPDLALRLDNRERNQESFDFLCSMLCIKWMNRGRLKFDRGHILPLCIQCQNLYQEFYHLQTQIRELGRLMKERVGVITGIIKKSESKRCRRGLRSTKFAQYGLDYLREKVINQRYNEDDSGSPIGQEMDSGPVCTSTSSGAFGAKESGNSSQILASPDGERFEAIPIKSELLETLYQNDNSDVDNVPLGDDSTLLNSQRLFQNAECEDEDGPSGGDDYTMDCSDEVEDSNPNASVRNKRSPSKRIPDHPPSAHDNVNEDSAGESYRIDSDSSDDSMEDDDSNDYSGVRTGSKRGRKKTPTAMSKPTTKRQRLKDPPLHPSKLKIQKRTRVKNGEQTCFKCHICDEIIPGRNAFIQHYEDQHPGEKRYTCKFCKEYFKGLWEVRIHQQKHTGEKPHECSYCSKRFTTKKARNNHHKWVHEGVEKRFECKTCGKMFPTRTFLKTHAAVHNKTVVFCKVCGKTYKSEMSFSKHNKENHEGKAECSEPMLNPTEKDIEALGLEAEVSTKTACHICWKNIHGRVNIQNHFDECHDGHPPLTCAKCGKQFTYYKDVRRHVLRHEGHKPLQCDKCPKKFLTTTELKNHSVTHLSDSEKPKYVCEICGIVYSAKSNLYLHSKVHEGIRSRWVCELCGKSYSERKGYIHHKKSVHLNETKHHCSYCPKSFVGPGELAKHLRIHTRQKPYKCPQCDKCFPYTNSRARHVREVHNNDKKRNRTLKKRVKSSSTPRTTLTPVAGPEGESTRAATTANMSIVKIDSEETEDGDQLLATAHNESENSAHSGYSECMVAESVQLI